MSLTGAMPRAMLLAAATVLAACGSGTSPEQRRLEDAEALWNATRPPSNSYVMRQQVLCFCVYGATTFEVTVTSDTVTKVVNSTTGDPLPAAQFASFRTVSQLFAAARDASGKKGTIRALEFSATRGYPTVLSLDPVPNAVDDEVKYVTTVLP